MQLDQPVVALAPVGRGSVRLRDLQLFEPREAAIVFEVHVPHHVRGRCDGARGGVVCEYLFEPSIADRK